VSTVALRERRARLTRGTSRRHFAARVDDARVSDGRQERGKRQVAAQDPSPQIAVRYRYGLTWAKRDFLKGPAIFAQSDFILRASVNVIEDDSGQSAARQSSEVGDIHHAR